MSFKISPISYASVAVFVPAAHSGFLAVLGLVNNLGVAPYAVSQEMKIAFVLPARLEIEIDQQRKLALDPDLPDWSKNQARRRIRQLDWRLQSETRYVSVNRWAKILVVPFLVVFGIFWHFSDPRIPMPTRLSDLYPFAVFLFLFVVFRSIQYVWRARMAFGCPCDDDKESPWTKPDAG